MHITAYKASKLLPDDILGGVLVLAQRKSGGRLRFRGHDVDLQQIFSDLAGRYPVIKKNFVFADSGPLPYSPSLNESISRLQLSGLIGRENPDYHVVFLRDSAEEYFRSSVEPNLDPRILEELREVADAFLAQVAH